MTSEEYQKYKVPLFKLLETVKDMYIHIDFDDARLRQVERLTLDLPIEGIDALIQAAAKLKYHQVYLIALKRKEQLNSFTQEIKENFKL